MRTRVSSRQPLGLTHRKREQHPCGLCGNRVRLTRTHIPPQCGGVTTVAGLYFLGLAWQHTRGSALLGFVKDDAAYLADRAAAAAPGT